MQKKNVLQVGAHEELVMNYLRNFRNPELSCDFVLQKNGIDFRFKKDPIFNGRLFYVTSLKTSVFRWIIELRRIIKVEKYRVVHLHLGWANVFGIIACLNLGVRVISHNHSFYQSSTVIRRLLRIPVKFIINYFSWGHLACSVDSRCEMFYADCGKVLANAIDYGRYRFDETVRNHYRVMLGLPNKLIFTHVGNFLEQKNHVYLLLIFSLIKHHRSDSILVLIGDDYGTMLATKQQVKALGLEADVLFLGPRTDIPEILSASDIFLFPSKFEGFGIALLEAQVNGLPCICSESIPLDAIITQSCFRSGIKASDKKSWLDAVDKCVALGLDNSSRILRSRTVPSIYDIKDVAHELEDIYLKAFNDC